MNDIVLRISGIQLPSTLEESEALLHTVNQRYWVARCSIESHIKREFFRNGEGAWRSYCMERWGEEARNVDARIAAIDFSCRVSEISETFQKNFPTSISHATALAKVSDVNGAAIVWQRAVARANGSGVTAQMVKDEVTRFEAEQAKNWHTLEEWNALSADEQTDLLTRKYGNKQFNKQDSDNIEWARWSWNPVTGCLHDCDYCYARDIAARFFPQNFAPTILPDRLAAPAVTPAPDVSQYPDPIDRIGWRNVFTCSMADLFGKWVPSAWIDAVLQQAWDNPQWTFLFLTKFPIRMAEFEFPPNSWIGTTVDRQWSVERAEKAFTKIRAGGYQGIAWLSCEPMMEDLTFRGLDMFDWVVVGGSSKSTQTPEFRPPFEWIVHLWEQAKACALPVYMKTNLGIEQRVREYPAQIGG